ncbi:MAG: SDR family NAD(P)-dependent oxidoreductase [Eubacteriales bacterium]|jgi:3-oxoacyl-[acyl-carrier protein] reductase
MALTGKTAVITGAAVGIGRATAIKFAQNKIHLSLLDLDFEKLQKLKEELSEYKVDVLIFKCDVSNEEEVNDSIRQTMEAFGRVDILVNNAAIWKSEKPFTDILSSEWKTYFDVNVMSVVYCTRAVLDKMMENKYGRIINVASVAGVYGNAYMTHYSATKGAVIAMTKALAKEVTDKGVLVNSVSPGSVSPSENSDTDFYQKSELSFMGRTGTDMENANLIYFLASDESSYISGQNIQIDGCRKKM